MLSEEEDLARQGVEIENDVKGQKFYTILYFDPFEIWIDFKLLGEVAFLCAMADSVPLRQARVGEKGDKTRTFVDIEWAINKWGADDNTIDLLKKGRDKLVADSERLRQKYAI